MIDPKKPLEQWGPIDARMAFVSAWYPQVARGMKRWKFYWPELLIGVERDRLTAYWQKGDIEDEGERAIAYWYETDARWNELLDEYLAKADGVKKAARKFYAGFSETRAADTRRLFSQWFDVYARFWPSSLLIELANYGAPPYLEKKLVQHVPTEELPHAMEVLLAPEKVGFHQEAEKTLLKLFFRQRKDGKLAQDLERHTAEWHWIDNSYFESKNLDAKYFARQKRSWTRTSARRDLEKIEGYSNLIRRRKRELIKKYHLPPRVARIARVLSESIWWQDHRKALIWWANSVIDDGIRFLSAQDGLPYDDLVQYTALELQRLASGRRKVSKDIISKRKHFCAVRTGRFGVEYWYGRKARALLAPFQRIKHENRGNILKGIVVSRGAGNVLSGRVRLIRSPRDAHGMKKGEILVTVMTSPDFVPAMRLASAVITDVGGLMSHAAVVSRELGLLCITNTKLATKALKTGDIVELDPSQGTARKVGK